MSASLSPTETESLLTLCLLAAFADGGKSDSERAELKHLAQTLSGPDVNLAALYQRVLLGQVSVAQIARSLTRTEVRQLAYEMAVCVCEADDVLNDPERRFLAGLRRELGLEAAAVSGIERQADTLAAEPPAAATPALPPVPATGPVAAVAAGAVSSPEVDRMILNYAILNGALELLPDSVATLAIVPLQMKLVYRVGKHHGYELDRGHIKELLGVVGVGLTAQVVEGYARKLLGGLLGHAGGGLLRGLGRQVASSAMAFASTWALGRLAQQYYGGGRTLSAVELRRLFGSFTEQARGLQASYAGAIRERAGSLDLRQLLPLIRGEPDPAGTARVPGLG